MKSILVLLLSIIPLSVFPQHKEAVRKDFKQSIYFAKNNGDTIRVIGEIDAASADSATIIVESIKFGKRKRLQRFKLEFYYPLELNFASYDNKNGITYTYDPRTKYGNRYLFLFNEKSDRLQEIKGYHQLGMIHSVKKGSRKYHYSYSSCGCADGCWRSLLFNVVNYKIDTVATVTCDCEQLHEWSKKNGKTTSLNCAFYNNKLKLKRIDDYWHEKIKIGLEQRNFPSAMRRRNDHGRAQHQAPK